MSSSQSSTPALQVSLEQLGGAESPEQVRQALHGLDSALDDMDPGQAQEHATAVDAALARAGLTRACAGSRPSVVMVPSRGELWSQGEVAVALGRSRLLSRLLDFIAVHGPAADREALYTAVWDQLYLDESSDNTLHVAINRLRRKIARDDLRIESTPLGGFALAGQPAVYRWSPPSRAGAETPAARTPLATNLTPLPNASFGRDAVAAEVLEQLAGTARLVSLVGTGGAGKTRLARMVGLSCSQLADPPAGGVWFIDLSEQTGENGFVQAIGQALDIPLTRCQTPQAAIERLGEAIASREGCWLILDNFEHLVESCTADLARIHTAAPQARILVTTREILDLPGEQVIRIGGLESDQAASLFADRATAVRPGLKLDASTRETISHIVEALDYLPLAIELAAARVRMLAPAQILERLNDVLRLLTKQDSSGPERHQTLRATIDWSWALLEPWEQDTLAQCAVFRGGFTVDAAELVIDLSHHRDAPWTLDVLQALQDQSLLQVSTHPDLPEQTRLRMVLTVRAYTAERLAESSAAATTAARHCAWAIAEAERLTARWYAADTRTTRLQMLLERDNLLAAHQHSAGRDPETHARLALALIYPVWVTGPMAMLMELLEDLGPGLPDSLLALIHFERGMALQQATRREDARASYEDGLTLARTTGDQQIEHRLLKAIGDLDYDEGRLEDAVVKVQAAVGLAATVGPRFREGHYRYLLANLHRHRGEPKLARTEFDRALAIHRAVGDRRYEGVTLGSLGALARIQGEYDEAQGLYEEALVIIRDIGDPIGETIVLESLGILNAILGRPDAARSLIEQALDIAQSRGVQLQVAALLTNLAVVNLDIGNLAVAESQIRQAITAHEAHGRQMYIGVAMSRLGMILLDRGSVEAAVDTLSEARAVLQQTHSRRFTASADAWWAVALIWAGSDGTEQLAAARAGFETSGESAGLDLCSVLTGFVEPASAATRIAEAKSRGIADGNHPQGRPAPAEVSIEVRLAIRLLERWLTARAG